MSVNSFYAQIIVATCDTCYGAFLNNMVLTFPISLKAVSFLLKISL